MDNVVEIEKSVAGLKKITLRAYLGKTQGSITVRPVKDRMTGRLKGVKLLTDEEARKTFHVVTHETERVIKDYTVIDLEDPIDAIDWEWMKYCPEIMSSLEECFSNHSIALFYIENLTKDTEDRIAKRHVKSKAFKYLENCPLNKMVDIARLIGTDASTFTRLELEDYLGELAETNPKRLVEAFEDKFMKVKLFLYGLVDKKIVQVDQDGVYRWNQHILGTSEKSALDWLQMTDNRMYVKRLQDELYPSPKIDDSGSFNLGEDGQAKLPTEDLPKPLGDEELAGVKQKEERISELEALSDEELKDVYNSLYGKNPNGKAKKETIIENIIAKETEDLTEL